MFNISETKRGENFTAPSATHLKLYIKPYTSDKVRRSAAAKQFKNVVM